MAASAQISLAEYMGTTYRPDQEFIDGDIQERNVGKWEHARVQWLLALWFGQHESEWGIVGSTEQRVRVSPTRVRVPDLVVMRAGPQPDVLVDGPLLVVEILSPDDSYADTQMRTEDYFGMGVGMVWVIDPKTRSGRMCSGPIWKGSDRLEVPGTAIFVELPKLFAGINPVTPSER